MPNNADSVIANEALQQTSARHAVLVYAFIFQHPCNSPQNTLLLNLLLGSQLKETEIILFCYDWLHLSSNYKLKICIDDNDELKTR